MSRRAAREPTHTQTPRNAAVAPVSNPLEYVLRNRKGARIDQRITQREVVSDRERKEEHRPFHLATPEQGLKHKKGAKKKREPFAADDDDDDDK